MDELKNKMDDMAMDKVSGGRFKPPWVPNHTTDCSRPHFTESVDKVSGGLCPNGPRNNDNVNSMAANVGVGET